MFDEGLKITVVLTTSAGTHTFEGGVVVGCALELRRWGFTGEAQWLLAADREDDQLITQFVGPEPMHVKVTIAGVHNLPDPPPDPLEVDGIVTEREVQETSQPGVTGDPVLLRRYTVRFGDRAAVLWRQHQPSRLYADTTVKTVVEEAYVDNISIAGTHSELTKQRAMICVPLGIGDESFYDWWCWFADTYNVVFTYDYVAQSYKVDSAKDTSAQVQKVRRDSVHALSVVIPELFRDNVRVQNSYTESASIRDVARTNSIAGIQRERMVRTPITADVDSRVTLETDRIKRQPLPRLDVTFSRFPHVTCWPGSRVQLQSEEFSSELFNVSSTYRWCEVSFSAWRDATLDDRREDFATYDMTMTALWEQDSDLAQWLPQYRTPRYPLRAEGKVVVDVDGARAYEFTTDSETSLLFYKLLIPLWNKNVFAPYEPLFHSGHLYVPAYRDSRVLVDLYFERCAVAGHLDWGPSVQLPLDGNGNHLLFGKTDESYTSVKHDYVDEKCKLTVYRVESADTELLTLTEGAMVLEVKEQQ